MTPKAPRAQQRHAARLVMKKKVVGVSRGGCKARTRRRGGAAALLRQTFAASESSPACFRAPWLWRSPAYVCKHSVRGLAKPRSRWGYPLIRVSPEPSVQGISGAVGSGYRGFESLHCKVCSTVEATKVETPMTDNDPITDK